MRVLITAIALLISYVSFGQITKQMPYIFKNNVTMEDTFKVVGALADSGKVLGVTKNASGEFYLEPIVNGQVTQSALDDTASAIRTEINENIAFPRSGALATTLAVDATEINCDDGVVFITSANTSSVNIETVVNCPVNTVIMVICGNATNPQGFDGVFQTNPPVLAMSVRQIYTFIYGDFDGGGDRMIEISRNGF